MAVKTAPDWATFSRRFWSKVDRTGECWTWTGSRSPRGYGRIRVGSRQDGTRALVVATHVAYELVNGPIPDGMQVLHRCDNPPCVRPDHLFLGTPLDNTTDMIRKGRARHPSMPGEASGHAKITMAAAQEIRARHAAGHVQRVIARDFGVSPATVCLIVNSRRWAA